MIKAEGCARTTIPRFFGRKSLDPPVITPCLRQKVVGAYQHIGERYSFLTPDVRLGEITYTPTGLLTNDYCEYEETFNSVLLGTILNALVNGNMLLFGPPGTGKTTIAEAVGQVLFGKSIEEIQAATIYCHPNLTEEKMVAMFNIVKMMRGEKEVIFSSWVMEDYRMLDEIRRLPPETSAILMQAIDRRLISYAGVVMGMSFGPIYATANYHDSGSFEMTRPFVDRFGISVHAEGLNAELLDMLWKEEPSLDPTSYALNLEERGTVYTEINSIPVSAETLGLLAHIAAGLSSCNLAGSYWYDKNKGKFGEQRVECAPDKCGFNPANFVCSQITEQGLTTRGLIALRDYSRALSWFLGRTEVDNEVMKIAFALAMGHRLTPSKKALNGGEVAGGGQIDRSLFPRRTFDFCSHIWDLGAGSFQAQAPIYARINAFFAAITFGDEGKNTLLAQSEKLIEDVSNMEDPARWEQLKVLNEARRMLRSGSA